MTMHCALPVGRTALLIAAALLLLLPGEQVASACCGPELDDDSGSFADFYSDGTGGSAPAAEGVTATTTTTWTQEFPDGEPEITEQVETDEYCPVIAFNDVSKNNNEGDITHNNNDEDDNNDEDENNDEEGGVAIDWEPGQELPPGLEGMNYGDLVDDEADYDDWGDAMDAGWGGDQVQDVDDDCSGCTCDDSCNDNDDGGGGCGGILGAMGVC